MHDRNYRDLCRLYPIDEPIAVNKYLSERFPLHLGDNSAAIGQLVEGLRRFNQVPHYRLGIPLRVASDVRGDLLNVFQRLGRPD